MENPYCCCRDVVVKKVLTYGVVVEVLPGVEGIVHQADLDIGHMTPRYWLPGNTMDVKLLDVRAPSFPFFLMHSHPGMSGA